jgi:hypothetical protein
MNPQPGELLVNEDVLSCGPLLPLRSIEEWARLREAYWDSVASCDDQRPFNRDLLANSEGLRDADSVTLWLGIGAAEQLLLAWTVKLLKLIGSRAQIHVVQFTVFGKHKIPAWANAPAWGVGLLNPEQIKHHPPATPVPAAAILELEHLWEGVTSIDPSALLSVLSESHLSFCIFAPACNSSFIATLTTRQDSVDGTQSCSNTQKRRAPRPHESSATL